LVALFVICALRALGRECIYGGRGGIKFGEGWVVLGVGWVGT